MQHLCKAVFLHLRALLTGIDPLESVARAPLSGVPQTGLVPQLPYFTQLLLIQVTLRLLQSFPLEKVLPSRLEETY